MPVSSAKSTFLHCLTFNVGNAACDRLEELSQSFAPHKVSIVGLQYTRHRLSNKVSRYDVIETNAYYFLNCGTLGKLDNDASSGVAIGLSKRIFKLSDIKAVWTPNDPNVICRLAIVRV